MFYEINPKKIFKLVGIPHEIVNYLNDLDEPTIKILILIFSESVSLKVFDISNRLNLSELQVKTSIKTLAEKNLICLKEQPAAVLELQNFKNANLFEISSKELVYQTYKNPKLYLEVEKLYKRPLTPSERKTLYYINSILNLNNEVILTAVAYFLKTKKSVKYLEKFCELWSNFAIIAKNQAEQQIKFINQIETIYKRSLSLDEHKILLQIQQNLNLTTEIILMAVTYCVKNNVNSIKQIKKLCISWSTNGVSNFNQAEQQIKILETQKNFQNKVKNCLGIEGRKLSTNEIKYINNWCVHYGFNISAIKMAFEKCVDSIGKLSFPYINKILLDFKNNNLNDMSNVSNFNEKIKNLSPSQSSSYNLQELKKLNEMEFLLDIKKLQRAGRI